MNEIPMQCRDCRHLESCFALCAMKEKPCRQREVSNGQDEAIAEAVDEIRRA